MLRRVARACLVALLVLLVAVTPLSAIFRPGYFESTFESSLIWPGWGAVRVVLEDRTGLVSGFGARTYGRPGPPVADRALVVNWLGGCSEQLIWMTFEVRGSGYGLDKQTVSNGCQFLVGTPRTVVLILRAPVDPTTVEFEALEATVR